MKPRDLLIDRLTTEIKPTLSNLGFRFAKSKLQFSRTEEEVKQFFFFSLSKWNQEFDCSFCTYWGTALQSYTRWHLARYDYKPEHSEISLVGDWNIDTWPRPLSEKFAITGSVSDKAEMKLLLEAIVNVGIPHLNAMSNLKRVADSRMKDAGTRLFSAVSDFYLIVGEEELARKALQCGLEKIENLPEEEAHALEIRRQKFETA